MARRTGFDEQSVKKIQPTDRPKIIEDPALPGFALRVQPSGRKVWILRYKTPEGRRTTKTLGIFPAYTYGIAIDKAKAILRGEDPDPKPEPAPEPSPVLTLGDYLTEHYHPYLKQHHSRPDESLSYLRAFSLDDKPLDQIRQADVETWRLKRLKDGKAKTTINRSAATLKAALQRAVDWDLLPDNPLRRLKPLKTDRRGVVRYLSTKEETRLLSALTARDDRKRRERESANEWRRQRNKELLPALGTYADNLTPAVLVSHNTGLRRGELQNLAWGDVDLKRRMLTVRGEGAKSGQTRHVPLNEAATQALKIHRGEARPLPTLPVFGRSEVKKAFAGVLRAAKIESFRWHDLRHSFASKLVMAGVPLNTVRELMGHASLDMTLIYAHLAPDNLREAVERLS